MSESILEEAQRLIHGERNKSYGHPRDNFEDIASLWNAYLNQRPLTGPLDTLDVANLMILMKVARVKGTGYHRDSYTDIAGYAGCAERLQEPIEPTVIPDGPAYLITGPIDRQWDSLDEVPPDVAVEDSDGDIWKHTSTGWKWSDNDGKTWNDRSVLDKGLAFTEVLG